MKVTITTLKAPWPAGAKVGEVVSFKGDKAPAWALGKFTLADSDAKADHKYEPADVVAGDGSGVALPSLDAVNAEITDLQAKLAAVGKDVAEAQDKAKAETARADDLQAKLAAAETALAAAKAGKK